MELWRKEDPPTKKTLPVVIDVPEVLAEMGMEKYSTEMVKLVGDCAVIVFYYLLQVGEYTGEKREIKQSKRCSSSWKIQFFFVRILKDICVNCQEMHWKNIFCLHME